MSGFYALNSEPTMRNVIWSHTWNVAI